MDKIAKGLTDYVIHNGVVKEEERELYEFGFLIALEMALSMIICFFIAFVLHMVLEGILFFIIFIPLRSYAGGLHLEKYSCCLALSCIIFSFVLLIAKFGEFSACGLFAILLGLELLVYFLYPVENINRQVEAEENVYFKRKLKLFLVIDILLALWCVLTRNEQSLALITMTIFMITATMIVGKLGKYGNTGQTSNESDA